MSIRSTASEPFRPQRIRGTAPVIMLPPPVRGGGRPVLIIEPQARSRELLGLDVDGLFALLLMTPLLFIVQLATLGAAAVAALTPVYLVVRRQRLWRVLAVRSFLLAIPALALLSVIWSVAPAATFRAGLQYGVTVAAGLLLASARNPRSVLRGFTLSFLIYLVIAIAAGGSVEIGVGAGGEALSGLTSSKNLLADIASTGVIVAIVNGLISVGRRRWGWAGLSVATILLGLYAVAGARSAGAVMGLAIGLASLLALAGVMTTAKPVRAWATGAAALCLTVAALAHTWLTQALIDFGAQAFDKDPTLTGRTYLWYRANELINEKPILGRGYYAFWQQGNLDAEGLWRYFGIQTRSGFTFHNTLVDILVGMGWTGVIVCAVAAIIGIVALIRRFVDRPSLPLVFWISILLYQLCRTPIETIGFAPFYFSTVLMFAALGSGFAAPPRAPARRPIPYPHPPLRQVWPVPEPSPLRLRPGSGMAGPRP